MNDPRVDLRAWRVFGLLTVALDVLTNADCGRDDESAVCMADRPIIEGSEKEAQGRTWRMSHHHHIEDLSIR